MDDKHYSSEGKARPFPHASVAALGGTVSRQWGGKEYHKVTHKKKPHTEELLRKIQEGVCLCSGMKEQRLGRKKVLYRASYGAVGIAFHGGLGLVDSVA